MKQFDVYLLRAIRRDQEWQLHYIDYKLFKVQLKSFVARRKSWRQFLRGDPCSTELLTTDGVDGYSSLDERDPEELLRKLSIVERNEFTSLIEIELSRCTSFAQELVDDLKTDIDLVVRAGTVEIANATRELLETFHFVVTNIITLRQILLRYEAFGRTYDTPVISEWDLQRRGSLKLFKILEPLASMHIRVSSFMLSQQRHKDLLFQIRQWEEFRSILDTSLQSVERATGGHLEMRDRILTMIRQYFLIGSSKFGLSLEPSFLLLKGKHLKSEMKSLGDWQQDMHPSLRSASTMNRENHWPLALNLISCFLFMMDNSIMEPSSAFYAAALGSSDAFSGIMIGAAPWLGILFSAVGYSFWTNYSYKHPMIFAGILAVLGNTLYGHAYSSKNMYHCLMGRALSGLGSPRVINRRYMADATPFSLRTASSAAFALATAMGSAVGPAMAILLDITEFKFNLPCLGTESFNGMTGPGFFMAAMWGIYTLLVLFTFSEPNRQGLEELREREGVYPLMHRNSKLVDDAVSMESGTSSGYSKDDDSASVSSLDSSYSFFSLSSRPDGDISSDNPCYCVRYMTKAVALCMFISFVKRISLESVVGSSPILTKNRYNWGIKQVGTLHLANGLLVMPFSVGAGWLSQFYEDRFMTVWFLGSTIVGMIIMFDITDLGDTESTETYNYGRPLAVGPLRFILGNMLVFSSLEVCESFMASLISKVVPSKLASGTFNSGLLATVVGTSGRALGDLTITLMALVSIRNLLNLVVIPGVVLISICLMVVRHYYSILAV